MSVDLAKELAWRVSPKALVHDLGRIRLEIGERVVEGTSIRRKALALLCYLLTRPHYSATRDQVIEALWPELDPDLAMNSVHQTVYFLRRVFEPNYSEASSPGYINFSAELLWLDGNLVSSDSTRAWSLIHRLLVERDPDEIAALSESYTGPFALEFSYEDWAVSYREDLHAAYLHEIESDVSRSIEYGEVDRGVLLARRALSVDAEADNIEVSLIRLYRLAGAHSAAAEQYSHYAAVIRELTGSDPPPISEV
jgi:DNA-binding SARP family transcriptional activator